MTFKDYLIVMAMATVAAWAGWIVVLVSIDPASAGWLAFVFFYTTLAVALVGTLSIAGAGVRVWFKREELVSRHVSRSFRQAILISTLVVGSLLLSSHGLFTWWVMTMLVATIGLVELVFISAQRPKM